MPTKNEILAVRALRNRKTRQIECKFTVEGRIGVSEALSSGWPIHGLYCTDVSGIPEEWKAERVTAREMERMSTLTSPPGVLAVVGMPDATASVLDVSSLNSPSLSLVLDGLSDPGNLGTIIRTADWFGCRQIFVSPDSVDAFNPKVVQATMGGIFRVKVTVVELEGFLKECSRESIVIAGLDLRGESLPEARRRLSESHVMAVVGSESHGLSVPVKEACTDFIHIPGGGGMESLNAAMAAGIVLAQWSLH
jgi:TrmH family RNA methyltransferase